MKNKAREQAAMPEIRVGLYADKRMIEDLQRELVQKEEIIKKFLVAHQSDKNFIINMMSPIDEMDALSCLLGMARKVDEHERYGYDVNLLNEIVLRRIRQLARWCQDSLGKWDTPVDPDAVVELKDEDWTP